MRTHKILFLLLIAIMLFSSSLTCFAEEQNLEENLIILQLDISEDSTNTISICYGYPIHRQQQLEKSMLLDDEFEIFISELIVDNVRYASINCIVEYTNSEDLNAKLQLMRNFNDNNTEWIRFHFYLILDSIVSNLNSQLADTTLSFTVNSDWLKTQQYHMTQLDNSIHNILESFTYIENRSIKALCFFVVPSTMAIDGNCQFLSIPYSETETAYRTSLNNSTLKINIESAPKEISPIDKFLNSKWYYMFLIGSGLFIVIAIKLMFIAAKSFNKAVEREEQILIKKTEIPASNIPELYLSKEQREALEKSGLTSENKNLFSMNDVPTNKTESIEVSRHRKNK